MPSPPSSNRARIVAIDSSPLAGRVWVRPRIGRVVRRAGPESSRAPRRGRTPPAPNRCRCGSGGTSGWRNPAGSAPLILPRQRGSGAPLAQRGSTLLHTRTGPAPVNSSSSSGASTRLNMRGCLCLRSPRSERPSSTKATSRLGEAAPLGQPDLQPPGVCPGLRSTSCSATSRLSARRPPDTPARRSAAGPAGRGGSCGHPCGSARVPDCMFRGGLRLRSCRLTTIALSAPPVSSVWAGTGPSGTETRRRGHDAAMDKAHANDPPNLSAIFANSSPAAQGLRNNSRLRPIAEALSSRSGSEAGNARQERDTGTGDAAVPCRRCRPLRKEDSPTARVEAGIAVGDGLRRRQLRAAPDLRQRRTAGVAGAARVRSGRRVPGDRGDRLVQDDHARAAHALSAGRAAT